MLATACPKVTVVTFLAPCWDNFFMWVITETVTLGNPSLGLVHLVDQDDVSEPNAASSPAEWYRVNINEPMGSF